MFYNIHAWGLMIYNNLIQIINYHDHYSISWYIYDTLIAYSNANKNLKILCTRLRLATNNLKFMIWRLHTI
jgi:hypothetical protein